VSQTRAHTRSRKARFCGPFRSVKELVEKIDIFVQSYKASARPFVWTATADSIFTKVQRLCERISRTAH